MAIYHPLNFKGVVLIFLLLFLAAWMYIGMVGGYMFILLQLILLIDFAYNWSESW